MASILALAPKIARLEGGYVNDPVDRGGCTNMGVTIGTYRLYVNPNGTCADLKRLTHEQFSLVLRKYWDRWRADEIDSQKVADILVDWVYHSGTWGHRIRQEDRGWVKLAEYTTAVRIFYTIICVAWPSPLIYTFNLILGGLLVVVTAIHIYLGKCKL